MEVTYHGHHSYVTDEGQKISFSSQLYQIGVYGIINNDPAQQGNFTPMQLKAAEKKLAKALDKGDIESL